MILGSFSPAPPAAARLGIAGLAATAAACSGTSGGSTVGDGGHCEPPVVLAELPASLHEASGVTRDPRDPDLFWVHNDSGNPAELYAVSAEGRVIAMAPVLGATNRDIEDVAVGPCSAGSCLYLADIGDNLAVHPSVFIHALSLPVLDGLESGRASLPAVEPRITWQLVYPAGPRDAESLAVDGGHAELIVVTKGREGMVELYVADLDSLSRAGAEMDTLRRVGRLALPIGGGTGQYVTAADLSPDGTRLAVRSYTTLYEFDWPGSAAFDTLASPRRTSLLGAFEAQGEGVAWETSGDGLVLVSEGRGGRPPTFSRIRCPVER